MSAQVLGYPDFSRPFDLETDATLQGLGAVLFQRDKNGKSRVIAYSSRSLQPNEQTMQNYSSAKLQLPAIKWADDKKFRDYLLGTQFTIYTYNNNKESKLGMAKIRWISKLVLFDFDIKYRTGNSYQAADAFSHHPKSNADSSGNAESEKYEMISYEIGSDDLTSVVSGIKLPIDIKS